MRRSILLVLVIGLMLAITAGCTSDQLSLQRGTPATLAAQATPMPSAETIMEGWEPAAAGLEFRTMELTANGRNGTFSIIRLDPARYHIRVAYDRNNPGLVSEWAEAVKPVALINGGYFDKNKRATALVIFDGVVQGSSYEGFGGMVVVNADGKFELRSLRQQPYDPSEPLRQAMQSSPMLIQPGGEMSELEADEDRSRRTVIARDRAGRILLMVSPWPTFTLPELARALKDSDLELDAALNLDGGRSTGLYINTPAKQMLIEAFDRLPLVLVVDEL